MTRLNKTDAVLNSMTAQEVFDKVVTHLLTQNNTSGVWSKTQFSCKYRRVSDIGRVFMCAAGCLIEDEEYDPEIEGKNWRILINDDWISPVHASLIENLQRVHDLHPVADWKNRLINVAVMHKLSMKVFDNFEETDNA